MKNIVIVGFWVKITKFRRQDHIFWAKTYMNMRPQVHEYKTFVQAWCVLACKILVLIWKHFKLNLKKVYFWTTNMSLIFDTFALREISTSMYLIVWYFASLFSPIHHTSNKLSLIWLQALPSTTFQLLQSPFNPHHTYKKLTIRGGYHENLWYGEIFMKIALIKYEFISFWYSRKI